MISLYLCYDYPWSAERGGTPSFVRRFFKTSIAYPALDADCILCNILHTNRSSLLAHDEQNLSPSQYKAFCKAVEKRQTGLPVAYIVGHKEFFGFDFIVTQDVLIPKSDTELLVELALDEIKKRVCVLKESANGGTGSVPARHKRTAVNRSFILPMCVRARAALFYRL